jgi:hypothetical protein
LVQVVQAQQLETPLELMVAIQYLVASPQQVAVMVVLITQHQIRTAQTVVQVVAVRVLVLQATAHLELEHRIKVLMEAMVQTHHQTLVQVVVVVLVH